MSRSLFILEGHDGAGKTLLSELLLSHFESKGIKTSLLKFPSKTPSQSLPPKELISFYLEDFKEGLLTEKDSNIIICDRSFISTLVYQGFENDTQKNGNFDFILSEGSKIFEAPFIYWVYLWCAPPEAARRISSRGLSKDLIDLIEDKERAIKALQHRYNLALKTLNRGVTLEIDTTNRNPKETLSYLITTLAKIELT